MINFRGLLYLAAPCSRVFVPSNFGQVRLYWGGLAQIFKVIVHFVIQTPNFAAIIYYLGRVKFVVWDHHLLVLPRGRGRDHVTS